MLFFDVRASFALGVFTLLCALSCSANVSQTPLGLGPLAVAERETAAQREEADQKGAKTEFPRSDSHRGDSGAHLDEEQDDDNDGNDDNDDNDDWSEETPTDSDSAAPASLAGEFSGEDVATFKFSGLPKQRQEDPKARIRVELGAPPTVVFVLINSDTGEDLCSLSAQIDRRGGSQRRAITASIDSGQPCFTDAETSSLSATILSGRATLRGDTLRLKARGELESRQGDEVLPGTLRYSFVGERE